MKLTQYCSSLPIALTLSMFVSAGCSSDTSVGVGPKPLPKTSPMPSQNDRSVYGNFSGRLLVYWFYNDQDGVQHTILCPKGGVDGAKRQAVSISNRLVLKDAQDNEIEFHYADGVTMLGGVPYIYQNGNVFFCSVEDGTWNVRQIDVTFELESSESDSIDKVTEGFLQFALRQPQLVDLLRRCEVKEAVDASESK